jgi:hypothetical protein
MPAVAFISYSHADEAALSRLQKHHAMLRRDVMLSAWTDHEILAGSKLDAAITKALEGSSLFLAVVSPDYLASNYCYDMEFTRALELEKAGKLRPLSAKKIQPKAARARSRKGSSPEGRRRPAPSSIKGRLREALNRCSGPNRARSVLGDGCAL